MRWLCRLQNQFQHERLLKKNIKILDSNYAKSNLKQVSNNAIHLNAEEITLLLSLLEDFEDFFDGTLGEFSTKPVEVEIKPGSKNFNSRYCPVPRINK